MFRSSNATGYDAKSWPVLVLILVVVLLPTLGVLWFMNQAMHNERLAVRQKLQEVYRSELQDIRRGLQDSWRSRLEAIDALAESQPAPSAFAESMASGFAQSVIILDGAGESSYPLSSMETPIPPPSPTPTQWPRAERLEQSGQFLEAAEAFGELAESGSDKDRIAQAHLAQARALVRAGRIAQARQVLVESLGAPELIGATDAQGRLIAPSAMLRALQLAQDELEATQHPTVAAPDPLDLARTIEARLNDYRAPDMPSSQRIFLMKQLLDQVASLRGPSGEKRPVFPTLVAESVAARYLSEAPQLPAASQIRASPVEGLWHQRTPDARAIVLFEQETLRNTLVAMLAAQESPSGTKLELIPAEDSVEGYFLVSLPAEGYFPDWRLVLRPVDQGHFATAADQQINAYLLTGVLVVVTILLLALLLTRLISRQLRLTQLKNDLLATVSHELKTPLASMRLLVDTLRDSETHDPQRWREYLELIANENSRLSRLVENFLTFSKLEKNRHQFSKSFVDAGSVVEEATASINERFAAHGQELEVDLEPDLPGVYADADALVTALINLLDNALKYSNLEPTESLIPTDSTDAQTAQDPDGKRIKLRVFEAENDLHIAVHDHGIGLSKRDASKIFDRFYQVDQSLSRSQSGCGLGLSIVKAIVEAHGGTVGVSSQLGEGSIFTIRIPTAKEGDPSHGR